MKRHIRKGKYALSSINIRVPVVCGLRRGIPYRLTQIGYFGFPLGFCMNCIRTWNSRMIYNN